MSTEKKTIKAIRGWGGVLLAALLAGCAGLAGTGISDPTTAASDDPAEVAYPPCEGPKKRVAVLAFGTTAKLGGYEGHDVGQGLAAQLTTALSQSGCFVVVDRLALNSVLKEQELTLTGIAGKESAARVGNVTGAQLLIRGEVTEFEHQVGGRSGEAGVTSKALTSLIGGSTPFGLRLGGESQKAHVAFDLRLIDTTTTQILQTHRVEGQADAGGLAVGFDISGLSLGGDQFAKTPMGKATRRAIHDAVGKIIRTTAPLPWAGRVTEVLGDRVYINAGMNAGLRVGDRFRIVKVVRELIDPETQEVLGKIEEPVGEIRVLSVSEKFSVSQPVGTFQTRRGDLVRRSS